ncbi:NAD(P)/FAD-dependent oxidoreductase [Nocardiopsis sp. NPDC055551]|uniref:NAD(P)/FAD-dependent oxidoreductase n=1 Tax=Nocardiopsis sp. NPDC006832 TaxID=3157188 RepID=UPI0033D442C3
MRHRVIVLGAGYAGAAATGYLARHLHPDDVHITVVNAESDFVERMRLHQVAAGRPPRRRGLADMFAGTGVHLKIARVTALAPERRTVTVVGESGTEELEYDTLLYTLGSTIADHGVPGVREHAFHVAGRPAAERLRQRLDTLEPGGRVLVVGGNLTAVEAATEIAEAHPRLRVALATTGEPVGWSGSQARDHLARAFARFGIEVHEHTTITKVGEGEAIAADGQVFETDVTVWAAGFAVHPIAADSGLAVAADGRISVDRRMRSVSHPQIHAAGDSVHAIDDHGRPLPMSCASAGFTRMQATSAIIAELTGTEPAKVPLSYLGNCVSLGSRDAFFQVVDGRARPKTWALRGWAATRVKSAVLRTVAWSMGHPTFGLPTRRRRIRPVSVDTGKVVAD